MYQGQRDQRGSPSPIKGCIHFYIKIKHDEITLFYSVAYINICKKKKITYNGNVLLFCGVQPESIIFSYVM